jgi:hypothetical protein
MSLANSLKVLTEGVCVAEVGSVGSDVMGLSRKVTAHRISGSHEEAPSDPLRRDSAPRFVDGLKFDSKTSFSVEMVHPASCSRFGVCGDGDVLGQHDAFLRRFHPLTVLAGLEVLVEDVEAW